MTPDLRECESITATCYSPIRLRPAVGQSHPGGGIPADTKALCGRDVSHGWDIRDVTSEEVLKEPTPQNGEKRIIGATCPKCVEALRSSDSQK